MEKHFIHTAVHTSLDSYATFVVRVQFEMKQCLLRWRRVALIGGYVRWILWLEWAVRGFRLGFWTCRGNYTGTDFICCCSEVCMKDSIFIRQGNPQPLQTLEGPYRLLCPVKGSALCSSVSFPFRHNEGSQEIPQSILKVVVGFLPFPGHGGFLGNICIDFVDEHLKFGN